jgi:hypothetical protein
MHENASDAAPRIGGNQRLSLVRAAKLQGVGSNGTVDLRVRNVGKSWVRAIHD